MILNTHTRNARGAALVSVLMAAIIVGVLLHIYFSVPGGGTSGGQPWIVSGTDRARDAVCAANRNALRTDYLSDQMFLGGQATSIAGLQKQSQEAGNVCPGHGRYYFDEQSVFCSQHSELPKFSEMLGL